MRKVMFGVCVTTCNKCEDVCTCGAAKGPHFKSTEHKVIHQKFVKNLFALLK